MRLEVYIAKIGCKAAAKEFGVSPRTTEAWLYRRRRPKPDKAKEIQQVTEGLVRFEECY